MWDSSARLIHFISVLGRWSKYGGTGETVTEYKFSVWATQILITFSSRRTTDRKSNKKTVENET